MRSTTNPDAPQRAYRTTREAAKMLGISLTTAQIWCENGTLDSWKTQGGHRRIRLESVQRLLSQPGDQPMEASNPMSLPMASSTTAASTSIGIVRPLRLLVVEDNGLQRHMYERVLKAWSIPLDLRLAENGFEGLYQVGLFQPDILISDLKMPEFDGFQMIAALDQFVHQGRPLPMEIIVATGLEDSDIAAHGGLPSHVRIMHKPVDFAALRVVAERTLAAINSEIGNSLQADSAIA